MKRQISLRWFIALAVLALGIVLVIGYSVLTAQYFMRGMDNIIAANMEAAVNSFVESTPSADYSESNSFDGYTISNRWDQLPDAVRDSFGEPPTRVGFLQKHDASGFMQRPDAIHFLMRFRVNGDELLISRTFTRENASRLVGRNIARNMKALLMISAASALAFAVIIWLLMKRVSRPAAELGSWAQALDAHNITKPVPDFAYPELNRLAQLIKNSVSSVQQSVEREHRFLRHASHELRTPISVIRSNVELIRKLQLDHKHLPDKSQQKAYDRIDRASQTMQHLTETLLWLSRDELETLPTQMVSIGDLIKQLVDDNRYLLADKHVEVELQTDQSIAELPDTAARIVLGNLIRNAFQHTWEGQVKITQRRSEVRIENRQADTHDNGNGEATGFGLGLQLTAQLSERLMWPYRNQPVGGGRVVEITLAN
ncbi:sensor histidine kinase [Thiosocius teredinicola]|uniref:sensor histidine kinase n=1 Tax=Thiosocius teredinicola TaxID=1973002 RepID=UPI000990D970